jgi:replicative DNA helicase
MAVFVHRPDYYCLHQSSDGTIDYRGKAEIIIAKHRKGATDIIFLDFKGGYTRFENPEDNSLVDIPLTEGGEIRGADFNGEDGNLPFPPPDPNREAG